MVNPQAIFVVVHTLHLKMSGRRVHVFVTVFLYVSPTFLNFVFKFYICMRTYKYGDTHIRKNTYIVHIVCVY